MKDGSTKSLCMYAPDTMTQYSTLNFSKVFFVICERKTWFLLLILLPGVGNLQK